MGNIANRLMLADYLLGSGANTRNYVKNPSAFKSTTSVTDSGAATTRNTSTPLTQISDFQIVLDATTDYAEFALNTFDNGKKDKIVNLGEHINFLLVLVLPFRRKYIIVRIKLPP